MNVIAWFRDRYDVAANPLLTERRIELAVVVLIVLLLLQFAYSMLRLATLSLPTPHDVAPGSLRIGVVESVPAVTDENRNEVVSRPLFWPSRRPVEIVATVAEEASAASVGKTGDLKKVKLLGTFGGEKTGGITALVNGKQQRILIDQKALEWTLESVATDRAVFNNGAQSQELVLAHAPLPGVSAAVSPNTGKAQKKNKGKKQANASSGIKRLGNPKNKTQSRSGKTSTDPNGIK
jgi:hypothetical protein